MRIFDATNQSNRDRLSARSPGLEHLPLVHLVNGAALRGEHRSLDTIDAADIQRNVDHALDNRAIICIDQELLWSDAASPKASEADRDAAHDFFRGLVDMFREAKGGHAIRIGIYGLTSPMHDHDPDVATWHSRLARIKYDRDNGRFADRGLLDAVDVLFPSIYLKGPASESVVRRTMTRHAQHVQALAKLTDCPVIPFVWFRHFPAETLQMMRELEPVVDGFAVWKHPQDPIESIPTEIR